MNCAVRSQTSDTLCFKIADIQKLLIAGKQKKQLDTLVSSLQADIRSYDIVVKELKIKDSVAKEIDLTRVQQLKIKDEQRVILEGQITKLNKDIKRQKVKTRLTGILGLLAIGATVFIMR